MNNLAEVESRTELVRAMPRRSNVSKNHHTQCGDYPWQRSASRTGTVRLVFSDGTDSVMKVGNNIRRHPHPQYHKPILVNRVYDR